MIHADMPASNPYGVHDYKDNFKAASKQTIEHRLHGRWQHLSAVPHHLRRPENHDPSMSDSCVESVSGVGGLNKPRDCR